MITPKDRDLVDFLMSATEQGTLRWEATADPHRFTVALRGEYSADIVLNPNGPDYLELRDAEGDVILGINQGEYQRMASLFQLARRSAYNVDKAIDEILGLKPAEEEADKPKGGSPITDEDIPF